MINRREHPAGGSFLLDELPGAPLPKENAEKETGREKA
jgi:hypothetical protein